MISPSGKDLRTLLDICEEYAISHLIKFNTVKSKILIVRSPSYSKLTFPKFHLAGSDLEEVTEYKYLGHFITNNLSDNRDITRAVNSLYGSGMGITRRFHMCSRQVKLRLFTSYCSHIYTSHLWSTYAASSGRKVNSAYNTVFRKLLGVPRYSERGNYSASALFTNNNILNQPNITRKNVYRFMIRINSCTNALVSAVCYNFNSSRLFRFWGSLLRPP